MGKNVDECVVISVNEKLKKFLNVNVNKAKGPDGLTGKIFKHVHHNCVILVLIY